METKNVYVLVHSNVDYVNVEVYQKRKDAIEALKDLAKDHGMDLYGDSAEGDGDFAKVEEQEVL